MIRYRPNRLSLSASLKDEQVFPSLDDLLLHIYEKARRIALYIGTEPPVPSDFTVRACSDYNMLTGYRNECIILFRSSKCVGYCGE